jgi:hypothetical protein
MLFQHFYIKMGNRIWFVFHIFIFNIQIIKSIVKEGDGIFSASEEKENGFCGQENEGVKF